MTADDAGREAARLLDFLRGQLGAPGLAYETPPAPILGGYDTRILAFRLAGAPAGLSGNLIARVFLPGASARAEREAALQDALVNEGYPAPRPLLVCSIDEVLGGPFFLMQRLPGRPMLETLSSPVMLWRTPALLAEMHARLHRLPVGPVAPALGLAADLSSDAILAGRLSGLRSSVAGTPALDGFVPGMEWLEARAPRGAPAAILHLDFHPINVLVDGGAVTGVIDWSNATIGDPAADVAATRILLLMGPVDLPRLVQPAFAVVRRWATTRYTRLHRRLAATPADRLRYYEALVCFESLLHVAERRLKPGGQLSAAGMPDAWELPAQTRLLVRHFERITGVPLVLPPARQ